MTSDEWAFGSGGFAKLYGDRLSESSLLDCHPSTRWVFVFMLSRADAEGRFRCASVRGVARAAAVSIRDAQRAIRELEAPDPDSTNPDHEGRRIERIDGGWLVLNYTHYREYRTAKQINDAERQRKHRDMSRDVTVTSHQDIRGKTTNVKQKASHQDQSLIKQQASNSSSATSSQQRKPPNVYWDTPNNDVVISKEWLRDELRDFAHESGVRFDASDYEAAKEDLRLMLLQDTRLRAVLTKSNGKPSTPSQFKRLASTTVTMFKRAIRRKAGRNVKQSKGSKTQAAIARDAERLDRAYGGNED